MLNTRSNYGFSFLELTIVLGIVSGLLLMLSGTIAHVQRQQLAKVMAADLANLKTALYSAQLMGDGEFTAADLKASNWYFGELESPWGSPYQIEYQDTSIVIRGDAASSARAGAVARLLPASTVNGAWVELFTAEVSQKQASDMYLHRQEIVGSPQLNSMETHLNMHGNNIHNIDNLSAYAVSTSYIDAFHGYFNTVSTGNLTADVLESYSLVSAYAEVFALSSTDAFIDNLQVQELHADELNVYGGVVFAHSLHVDTIFSGSLNAVNITAENISVAGAVSAAQAMLTNVVTENMTAELADITQVNAGVISAEQVFSNQVETNYLHSGSLTVAGAFFTNALTAKQITASDFITPTGSLSQLHIMLSNYQQLWDSCVASGSCEQ